MNTEQAKPEPTGTLPEMVIEKYCQQQEVTFWGQSYTITPAPVHEALGDGKQIIGFTPLASRPDYYVLAVDSKWSIDNWDGDATDYLIDHTDEIYETIEEQYGNAYPGDEDDEDENAQPEPFPALNDECGSSWWTIEIAEVTP